MTKEKPLTKEEKESVESIKKRSNSFDEIEVDDVSEDISGQILQIFNV